MKSVTAQELAKLKDRPKALYCLEFEVGSTTYRYTNADYTVTYNTNDYLAGVINEVDEIEITSDPRTNDINIELFDPETALGKILLTQAYMNKPCSIERLIFDADGDLIIANNVFKGLLSDISINYENNITNELVSSIWAGFEKQSGIKTNSASQQRFYPNDTAFEHAASATNKIYWGKDAPTINTSGSSGPSEYDPPSVVTV